MKKPPQAPRGAPLAPKLRIKLAAVVLKKSERAVAKAAYVSRQSLARALASLPIYRGTVSLIERYLEREDI